METDTSKAKLIQRLRAEDNFTERKLESDETFAFRKTIVSFANSISEGNVGVLYIGVENNGAIRGVNGSDSLQKTIRKICEVDCYPPIRPTCSVLQIEGKDILAVEIGPSKDRPHFSGPAFVRIGSESKEASRELFEELLTSHCSMAGQLLKLRGQTISVWTIGKKLGDPRPTSDSRFNEKLECKLSEVTPTSLKFELLSANRNLSEPLGNNIQLTRDEEKHRPLLIVRNQQ